MPTTKEFDIERRLRFAGLLDAAEALRAAWRVVEPELPDILAVFYRHLVAEPLLSAKLGPHVSHLKDSQTLHWKRLFSGAFDHEYMAGVYAVGAVHRRIGLDIRWYIAGYQILLNQFIAVLSRADFPERDAAVAAVVAAVLLDIDLAIEAYNDEMDIERGRHITRIASQLAQEMGQKFDEVSEVLVRKPKPAGTHIRRALRNGEFYLVYQPIVSLEQGRCVGAEVLIRWETPDGREIPPDVFIPVAEERGLIRSVTRFVVEHLADEAAALMRKQADFHLSINFAKDDMESLETLLLLKELCERTQLRPQQFWIEATERGFLNLDKAVPIMKALRDDGFAVAIDDFGTGYSSLSSLAALPVTHLKIDRAFVNASPSELTDGVTHHIIAIARKLRLQLVAEGIETESQRSALAKKGVAFGQGWLFSQPLTMDQLTDYVARHP